MFSSLKDKYYSSGSVFEVPAEVSCTVCLISRFIKTLSVHVSIYRRTHTHMWGQIIVLLQPQLNQGNKGNQITHVFLLCVYLGVNQRWAFTFFHVYLEAVIEKQISVAMHSLPVFCECYCFSLSKNHNMKVLSLIK